MNEGKYLYTNPATKKTPSSKKVNVSNDGKTVRYYSADNGNYSELSIGVSNGRPVILLTSYLGDRIEDSTAEVSSGSGDPTTYGASSVQWELVSQATITKKLGLKYGFVEFKKGIITFKNLQVLKNNSNVLAELDVLEIKVISMA